MRALFVFFRLIVLPFRFLSQNAIRFAYDALGNRVKREIVLQKIQMLSNEICHRKKKKRIISIPTCSLKNRSVFGPTQRKGT